MNQSEFNTWWQDTKTCWPSFGAWLVRCFDDANKQRECLRKWAGVFFDVELSDALEINQQMQSGQLRFIGNDEGEVFDGDRERFPEHVRRLAKRLAWERSGRIEQQESPRYDGSISNSPQLKKNLLRWRELQDQGHSRDDAKAMALEEFPVGQSPYREPRYQCHLCLDQGCVIVASNAAIEAMVMGLFDQCHHREAVVRCKCDRGRQRVRKQHGRDLPWATYDAGLCFKIQDSLIHNEKEIERFREWVEVQHEKRSAAMAQANENFEPAFAAFNQREAF